MTPERQGGEFMPEQSAEREKTDSGTYSVSVIVPGLLALTHVAALPISEPRDLKQRCSV